MAEKKSRWGRKKEAGIAAPAPAAVVLPVRRTDYDLTEAVCVGIDNYFTFAECERYMQLLQHELDWRRQDIEVGGIEDTKTVAEPRKTLFMSDPGVCYEYSGRENEGVGWHPAVLEIKERVERAVAEESGLPPVVFNSVQLNRYEGPRHALGFHADNEPDLARGEPIVSVSFGVTREFVVMDREDNNRKWIIPLSDGTFFLMGGNFQMRYLHGVPPGGDAGLRINLTFRVCIPRERYTGPAASAKRLAGQDPEGRDAAPVQRAIPGGGRGNLLPARSGTPASLAGGGSRWGAANAARASR